MERVFNAMEAADYLAAHVETVRRLARRGEIPSFKVGKDWRFRQSDIDRWMETQHSRHGNPHILAIDDEKIFLHVICRILRDEPYRISTAIEGVQALDLILLDPPDVVLLDLKMPGMSGPAILKEIRKINENLPVIIITAYPDSELMMEAMSYSPIMVLPKRVEKKLVIDAVEFALNGSQSKRAHAGRS